MRYKCLFIVLFATLLSSYALAEQAILVPPDLLYPKGGDEEECVGNQGADCYEIRQCQKLSRNRNALMIGELGRSVYFSLGSGLRKFNEDPLARGRGTRFRVKALAYPSCANFSKIKKFYKSASTPGFLEGVFEKHNVELIVWADFPSSVIRKCQSQKSGLCHVPLQLFFATDSSLVKKEIILEFEAGQGKFTRDSCNLISAEVEEFVKKTFLSEAI